MRTMFRALRAAAPLAMVLAMAAAAHACPTCGAGMSEAGEAGKKMLSGWFWSIVFMMSMPFTILASLGGYMYYLVRKARRGEAASALAASDAPERFTADEHTSTPFACPQTASTRG